MKVFQQKRRIMFADCDSAQIVFYPNFFQWFDRSTQCMFEEVGLNWSDLWPNYNIAGVPLVDAQARFIAPLRMEDDIVIDTWIEEWGNTVWTVRHNIRKDDFVHVEGTKKRVWAVRAPETSKGIRAEPMPPDVCALLGRED